MDSYLRLFFIPPIHTHCLCQRAFEIDNTNSMVLNHMSNLNFHKWNSVVVVGAGTGNVTVRTEMKSVVLETR